jgi:predicted molibdopterin-dependent oxidoreductase YjgC
MDAENIININGNQISFVPGETILEVAKRSSIDIPVLCHLKGATTTGSCQICVVEVDGSSDLVTSCSTKAEQGMNIKTESPKVVESRYNTIQKFLSSGNHNCAISRSDGSDWTIFQMNVQKDDQSKELCPVWGDCELQDLAYRYQVTANPLQHVPSELPMETANPFIVRDFSRCILCGKCVRACREIQVNDAIEFDNPESPTKIIASSDDKVLKDSDCVFCGECIQVCPVGALVEKDVRYKIRPRDTEKVRTTCSYCGVGCQMHLHVKDDKVVKVTGVEGAPPNYGSLCVKGRFGYNFIDSPERLTTPLIKENGEFREASWEEAFTHVADNFNRIKNDHGSNSIGVLTSARVSNEENYLANKFTRAVLKTNNIDHCARL